MIDAVFATLLFAVSATCGNRSARLVGGVEGEMRGWPVVTGQLGDAVA